MRALVFTAVLAVAASACATQQVETPVAQPAVAAFDPVGTYEFTTDVGVGHVGGGPLRGTLVVSRDAADDFSAVLSSEATGEVVLDNFTLVGQRAEIRAGVAPEGELVMRLEFHADGRLTGAFETTTGHSGVITGRRRP